MSNLENILDITIAIRNQKKDRVEDLPKIIEDLFEREKKFFDTNARIKDEREDKKDFQHKLDNKLFEKKREITYSPLKMFSNYLSMLKDKFYGYYSKIKKAFMETSNGGYTDKLLMEFEDWGVIYYKPAFRKLVRLTPLGKMQRYLEKLWIYIAKKIK